MPVFVYDIWPDGRAEKTSDMAPVGPAGYRWFHFDLADPDLEPWSRAHLPAIPAEALIHAETRPRCDLFEEGIILNLRAVNLNPGQPVDLMVSVRMWVTERTVVTVRKMRVFALDEIAEQCADNAAPPYVGDFLAALIRRLARRVHDQVLEIDQVAEELELRWEDTDEMPDISELRQPRRQVIRMLRYLMPLREAIERLLEVESPVLDHVDRVTLREPVNLVALSTEVLVSLKSRLEALHEAVHADVTSQLARNNYVLSTVAAVFLPLSFVTGLFGVNLGGIPGAGSGLAFAMLCIALAALGGGSVVALRWLRML